MQRHLATITDEGCKPPERESGCGMHCVRFIGTVAGVVPCGSSLGHGVHLGGGQEVAGVHHAELHTAASTARGGAHTAVRTESHAA
jgi:hypothetical protein